jgi:hypothetical protein
MLQGYMDDSGSEPKGQLFLISGFILETEQWERFSDEWQFQLHRDPRIDYFKMHEAVARVGQFEGWNKEFVLCKVTRRAGLFLYGLQIASQNVERNGRILPYDAVESTTQTEDGDELAPEKRVCGSDDRCFDCPERDTCENFDPEDIDDEEEEEEDEEENE